MGNNVFRKSLAIGIEILFIISGLIIVPFVKADLNDGLVGYWNFNEGSGNVLYDYSGYDNNGTIYGAPSWVDGVSGKALYFDGYNDYVDLGNPTCLNPQNEITIAAWFKPVSFSGTGSNPIVNKDYYSYTYPYGQYKLSVTGNLYDPPQYYASFEWGVTADGKANEPCQTVNGFWTPGNWYYIVGTYTGFMLNLYVNINNIMTLVASVLQNGTMEDYGKNVLIAKYSNLDYFTPGTIDEIRIYNRPLNQGEIQYLYDNPSGFVCDAGGPYYGYIKQNIQFEGYATNGSSPYSWLWDFGDGTNSVEQNPIHSYSSSGNYTVVLTVTDNEGNNVSDLTWAEIKECSTPQPPIINGPTKGVPNVVYDYVFLFATDSNGDEIYLYVDFGDGNTGWIGPYLPGSWVIAKHSWSEKGTYTIKAKTKNICGESSSWSSLKVTIPRNKIVTNTFLQRLFKNHPNLFQILQKLLNMLGQ